MTPDDFLRSFVQGFGAGDAAALAGLMAGGGTALTLSGGWAEGPAEAEAIFAGEFAGLLGRARLVTGKGTARSLFPGCYLIRQRFVVTGATDAAGAELPRFGAMLVVVLGRDGAENLTFAAVS